MVEIKKVTTQETGIDAYVIVQNAFIKGDKGDFPQAEADYATTQGNYAFGIGNTVSASEVTRINSENTRIDNENTRQSQETTRQTNTTNVINSANTATANANDTASQILSDKANGVFKGDQGYQGIQGIQGNAFNIKATFTSIASMSGTGLTVGDFVLISTGNTQDEDNAKLYIWVGTGFNYITDLSGATGIQGQTGSQGIQGIQGIQGNNASFVGITQTNYNTLVTNNQDNPLTLYSIGLVI